RNNGIEFLRQRLNKVRKFRGPNRLVQILVCDGGIECDVFPQREIEKNAVLEDKAYLAMQRFLQISIHGIAVEFHRTGIRFNQSSKQIQELCLPGGSGA